MQKIKKYLKSKLSLFKKISLISFSFLIALLLYMGIIFVYAWEEPSGVPPTQNVPAPINVGYATQTIEASKTLKIKDSGTDILSIIGTLNVVGPGTFQNKVGIKSLDVLVPAGNVMLEVQGGSIKATGGLIIETRDENPTSSEVGRMWLCVDNDGNPGNCIAD